MGFLGIMAYLIQMYIRPQDWMSFMYGFPLVDLIGGITIIIALFSLTEKKRQIALPQLYFMLLFLFMVFLSNIFNNQIRIGVEQFILYTKRVAVFFMILCLVRSGRQLKIVISVMIILTVLLAIQAIYQSRLGIGLAGQPLVELHGFGGGRASWIGAWDGPNVLCLLFVVAIALSLGFITRSYNLLWRYANCIFIIIMTAGVYVTNSRGGFIGLLMVILAFFWVKLIKKKRLTVRLLVVLIAMGLILAGLKFGPSRISELNTEETSAHERKWLWENALNNVRDNPFFGVGKGQFYVSSYSSAHSNYAQNMAEMGLPGLFLYIGFIYFSTKGLLQIIKAYDNNKKPTALAGIPQTLLISIAGFAAITFFLTMELDFSFVLFGLYAAAFNIAKKEKPDLYLKLSFKDVANVSCAMLGVIFLIYLVVIKGIM